MAGALTQRKMASRFSDRGVQPLTRRRPTARLTIRLERRPTRETSCPASLRRAAINPPMAPGPETAILIASIVVKIKDPALSRRVFVKAKRRNRLRVHHLGFGNISLLVEEVKETLLLRDAGLCDLFLAAAFLSAAGHLRLCNIALLVDVVQVAFLALKSELCDNNWFFLSHLIPLVVNLPLLVVRRPTAVLLLDARIQQTLVETQVFSRRGPDGKSDIIQWAEF